MNLSEILKQIQQNLNLKPSSSGGCFGAVGGVPVHYLPFQTHRNQVTLGMLVWIPKPEEGAPFAASLPGDAELAAAGFDAKALSATGSVLVYAFPAGFLGGLKLENVTRLSARLLKAWKGRFEAALTGIPGRKVALVNGQPVLATPAELEEIRTAGSTLQEAYGRIPTNHALGLAGAFGVSLLGAVVWGLIGAYLNLQAWIVAIAIGWGISWVAVKLSGQPDKVIRLAAIALTVASVVLGQILTLAFACHKEFKAFPNLITTAEIYFELLKTGAALGDFLFAVGGGAIGAWYAAKRAAPPALAPKIETLD